MDHWAAMDMDFSDRKMRASHSKPAEPLGGLSVTLGGLSQVRPTFEALASEATYTRQISLLWPETFSSSGGGSSSGSGSTATASPTAQAFAKELLAQKFYYEMHGVNVGALGDQQFTDACESSKIAALSRSGAGFSSGSVVAVLPKGKIHIAVDELTFQRLGFEEPAPGAKSLAAKLLPSGRRHLEVSMGLSKTRIKKAGGTSLATSFWRQQVGIQETCSMLAYSDRPTSPAEESQETGDSQIKNLSMVLTGGGMVRRLAIPTSIRALTLGTETLPRPPFEQLVWHSGAWSAEAYGEVCEDLADWIGLLSLALASRSGSGSGSGDNDDAMHDADGSGKSAGDSDDEDLAISLGLNFDPGSKEIVNIWRLGDTLTGPHQIKHTLNDALKLISATGGPTWFLLSVHLAEEQPTSLHGGCHDFDLHGAQHFHLLVVRSNNEDANMGAKHEQGELPARCLLLVSSNAQQTKQ